MDVALERAVAELVAIGALAPDTPTEQVTDLVVTHARGLEGIEEFPALQTLSLTGADLDDWSRLAALERLSVLAVEYSTLADVGWLRELGLAVVVLRCNRLVDVEPLGELAALQSVDLRGNPLSSDSFAWARDVLTRRANVLLDDQEAWRLCRQAWQARVPAVVYRDDRGLRAAWTGLSETDAPEAEHPVVSAAAVRAALSGPEGLRALIPTWRAPDA